ncbi:hypothetical protein, partial [Quadrisphaera granulorum]|uniref:hypothetical protein n=1 Tax=Quadrisphaera granulorum TaxID=317664 RepID=UPI001B87BCD8
NSAATLIFFSLGVEITGKVRPARSSTGSDHSSLLLVRILRVMRIYAEHISRSAMSRSGSQSS